MAFYFPNVDPTYIYRREPNEYLFLSDERTIRHGRVTLREIPWFDQKVTVKTSSGNELVEVTTEQLSNNEFRVDYSIGIVFFNENLNGQTVICEYHGTGYVSISANRIWMDNDVDDPVETLQEALSQVDEGIEILREVGDLTFKGEFNESTSYKKWNFVSYNNKTYVATENTTGESPSSSSKWSLVSSGVDWVNKYNPEQSYSIGDMVSDSESQNLYISNIDANNSPLSDTEAWTNMISFDGLIQEVQDYLSNIDNQFDTLRLTLSTHIEEAETEVTNRINNLQEELEELVNSSATEIDNVISEAQQSEQNRSSSEQARIQNEQMRNNSETQRQSEFDEQMNVINTSVSNLNSELENAQRINQESEALNETTSEYISALEPVAPNIVNFTFVGEYNPDSSYKKNNLVLYNGSTYISLTENTNVLPDNSETWELFASKGQDGEGLVSTVNGLSPDVNGNINLGNIMVESVNGQIGKIEITAESIGGVSQESLDQTLAQFTSDLDIVTGNLEQLETNEKDSLVAAINEIYNEVKAIRELVEGNNQ